MSNDRYRFTEERIADGDPLYVLGRLTTPRRGCESRERLRLALLKTWKRDPARLARFDTNRDGQLDAVEWARARSHAGRLAARSELLLGREPVLPRVGATGDPRQPFAIAAYLEDELAAALGWRALGLALGFILLAVALAYALTARLGSAG